MIIKKHNVICNIIFLYIIFISLYFTNADCKGCSCKSENNKLKSEENNPCCKSCKGNKFQDVTSGSKEMKKYKAIKKNNKKNNMNYDEIRKISNKKKTNAAAEDFVNKQKEVGRELKIRKRKNRKRKNLEEKRLKKKEEDEKLKLEKERIQREKEENEKKLKEEEGKRKLEEEKRREKEEQKRIEKERIKKEKQEKEEEKKEEEEGKKKEEEDKRLKEEAERKKKEEEERLKKEEENSKNLSTMEGENKILNNYIKKYLEEFKKENEEFLKKIKSYKKGYHYYNKDNNVKNLYNTYQQYEKIFSEICNKNDGNIKDKHIKYIKLKEGIEEIKEKKKETFENFIKKINKSDKYLSILKTIIKELVLQKYFNLDDIAFLFKEKNEENNQNILIQNKELDMDFEKIKEEMYKVYNKHLKDINEIQEFKAVEDLYKKTLHNIEKIKTIIKNIEKIRQEYSSYKYTYGEKTKNHFVIIEKKLYYPLDSLGIHNIPINFEDFEKIIEEDITKKQSNSEELIKKIKNNKEQTTNYIKNMKLKINESEQNLKEFVETFVNCFKWATENNYRTEETPSDREKYDDLYKNLSKILNKEKDIFEILLNKKINRNERDLIELASETTETIDKMTDFFDDLFINIFYDKINNIFKGINRKYSEQKEEKKRQKEEFMEYFKNCKFNIKNIKLLSEKLDNKLKEYEQYINN